MIIFIEFIAGTVTGAYLYWALKFGETVHLIFGVFPLLAAIIYLVREKMPASRRALSALQGGDEITTALSAIKDRECRDKALELLDLFRKNLELLECGYLLLSDSEFYWQSRKALERTAYRIRTVEQLQPRGGSHDTLLNCDQANQQALARGVQITRIFIIDRHDLFDRSIQRILQQQSQAGVDTRIVYREANNADTAHNPDFAIYDDTLVIDRGRGNSGYFGKQTNKSAEIEKYLRFYQLIERHAQLMSSENVISRLQLFEKLPI